MLTWIRKNIGNIALVIAFGLILIAYSVQLNYSVYLPGGADNTNGIVTIDNAYSSTGTINSSYVSVITKATPFQILTAVFSSKDDIVRLPSSDAKVSVNEINESDHLQKVLSIYTALEVAYEKAGKTITYDTDGAIVISRDLDYSTASNFRVGDIITAIDGQTVKDYTDLQNIMNTKSCADTISLTVLRGDYLNDKDFQTLNLNLKRPTVDGACKFGISLSDYIVNIKGTPGFTITNSDGYGPSAGLMQTLAFYNDLVPQDLTHGLKIAGTGLIDPDGTVGPIGGIKQKVYGACEQGVNIFFAPDIVLENPDGSLDNLYQDAVEARDLMHSKMIVVPVTTFDDVLNYLNSYTG